jgi:hypothetical protein
MIIKEAESKIAFLASDPDRNSLINQNESVAPPQK